MRIRNFLPTLAEGMERWEKLPSLQDFSRTYFEPMGKAVDAIFESAQEAYATLKQLDFAEYRQSFLKLDPVKEEQRAQGHLEAVEAELGIRLQGEVILFAAFHAMDGYARFDRGSHRVYLGVDESHSQGEYLDILETHELTHVARESRPSVWTGWGLDPKMSHDEFVESQPVIEHLFGEGFSCTVSERLVASRQPWHYVYQSREDLKTIFAHARAVDEAVHRELALGNDGDWGRLYSSESYRPRMPVFTHYVWGWQWTKQLVRDLGGGSAARILNTCSRELFDHAMSFRLEDCDVPAT
jgi:hypothetical protein